MASPPPLQVSLAEKYGKQYGVDPRLLLAIGGHETQWGTTGAGRPSQGGYALGYGVTDSGILSKYAGLQNQYMYGAKTLGSWGVHSLADVMAGKAARWATDPAWEKGVQSVYGTLNGALPTQSIGDITANAVVPGAAPSRRRSSVVTRAPAAAPAAVKPRVQTWQDTVFDPGKLASGIFSSLAAGGTPDVASLVASSQSPVTFSQTIPGTVPVGGKVTGKNSVHIEGPKIPGTPISGNLAATAAKQLGQPYVWGAESRKEGGFDCSGLVDWSLRQQGYTGPRVTTYTLKGMGQSVKNQPLRPGDLVLCNNYDHVVIYAGNGKVIAAPHTGTVVQYQPLSQFHINDIRRL